jgi:acetyl esterase/lipase
MSRPQQAPGQFQNPDFMVWRYITRGCTDIFRSFCFTGHNDSELEGLAAVYLGNNASNINDPLASPVEGNYTQAFPNGSLPPTLIQVGLRETLLSDAVRLYHKMKDAAPAPGHVVLSPYEGMWHVFQAFFSFPEAQAASREMAAYFTRALNGQSCK